MNRQQRLFDGSGQTSREGTAHQQRADQARSGRVGNAIEIRRCQACLGKHGSHQHLDAANMVSRCKLRHHAAVLGMHRRLAVQYMGEQTRLAVIDRGGGFIAGGFKAENAHAEHCGAWRVALQPTID